MLAAIAADLAVLAGSWFMLPLFAALFIRESALIVPLTFALYVLMYIAHWLLRGVWRAAEGENDAVTGFRVVSAVGFAAIPAVILIEAGRVLKDGGALDAYSNSTQGGIATGAAVLLMFLPIIALNIPAPRIKAKPARYITSVLCALAISATVLFVQAFWEWYFRDTGMASMAAGGHILVFVMFFFLLSMFYAPPRLLLIPHGSRWPAWVGYFAVTGFFCWRLLYGM